MRRCCRHVLRVVILVFVVALDYYQARAKYTTDTIIPSMPNNDNGRRPTRSRRMVATRMAIVFTESTAMVQKSTLSGEMPAFLKMRGIFRMTVSMLVACRDNWTPTTHWSMCFMDEVGWMRFRPTPFSMLYTLTMACCTTERCWQHPCCQ